MTLLNDVRKVVSPAELATCCIGCGDGLDTGYQELLSGLYLCGACLGDAAVEAGWSDDTGLQQAREEGEGDGRREGIDEAKAAVKDLLEPPEGARERVLEWTKST